MNKNNIFESRRPLIAILRGITPLEAESVSDVLIEAGISIIEVPLNSPQPFETIERMVKFHGNKGIFGAGTVLKEYDVYSCLLYTSPSPRDRQKCRMPS